MNKLLRFKININPSDFIEGVNQLTFSDVNLHSWDAEYEYTINGVTNTGIGIGSELVNAIISGNDEVVFEEIDIIFDFLYNKV